MEECMAENNDKGMWGLQEKLIAALVLTLVVATGGLGYLYGKLTALTGGVLKAGSDEQTAEVEQRVDGAVVEEVAEPLGDELWAEVVDGPAASRGDDSAAVVMAEFTDYQCPYCARHYEQTEQQLIENYIDQGKVKHVMRDLPLPFHENSKKAAEAARCAGDQGKYWEMHDEIFANQEEWSAGDSVEAFSQYATKIGLNVSSFDQCLSSGKFSQAVEDDLILAQKVGASGTPTFFVNGEILVGAQPYESFEAVIEAAL